jgi:hypothetical protein
MTEVLVCNYYVYVIIIAGCTHSLKKLQDSLFFNPNEIFKIAV